jgi:hypothetical protein
MSIKASEISDLIGQRIENFAGATEDRNVGSVVSVTDGIVRVHGLADARYGEMLEFPGNIFGLALNLEQDSVGAVVLGEYKGISEGNTVRTTGRILEVPVGPELLGRVVDALGNPIDGKGPLNAKATAPIERVAPGVAVTSGVGSLESEGSSGRRDGRAVRLALGLRAGLAGADGAVLPPSAVAWSSSLGAAARSSSSAAPSTAGALATSAPESASSAASAMAVSASAAPLVNSPWKSSMPNSPEVELR